jgi:hypothetical protein
MIVAHDKNYMKNIFTSLGFFLTFALSSTALYAEAGDEERQFLSANDTVMQQMMDDMVSKPTGNIDKDFVSMMVPHHQGAIRMAELELEYGRDEHLRRIAQEIIVEQQQEINAMYLAIGKPLLPTSPAPDQMRTSDEKHEAAHHHMVPGDAAN